MAPDSGRWPTRHHWPIGRRAGAPEASTGRAIAAAVVIALALAGCSADVPGPPEGTGTSPIPIEPATPAPDRPRDPTTLADAAYRGAPGAVFLGVSDPRTSSFAAAGEDGAGTAVTADTPWAGASLSKMVVATSVLQLTDRGLVDLDQPVRSYVGFDVAESITVRDVMRHSSGIPNMTEHLETCPATTTLETMKAQSGAATAPGEPGDYSNTNYILLGAMVGTLTGADVGAHANTHIFGPLGMTSTYWWESQDGPAPYWPQSVSDSTGANPFTCPMLDQTVGTEGLSFITTLGDMDLFLRGLFGGDLISGAALEEMLPAADGVGLGLWSETNDATGVTMIGHFGSRGDFATVAYYEPSEQRSVVAFSDTGAEVEELMWEAIGWAETTSS